MTSPNPFVTAINSSFSGGRANREIWGAFGPLIKKGELVVYEAEEDREEVLRDTPEERLVRTLKGVTLRRKEEPEQLYNWNHTLVIRRLSGVGANQGIYVARFYGGQHERPPQFHYEEVMHLEKLAANLDLGRAVPDNYIQGGTNKAGLQFKDQHLAASLSLRSHSFGRETQYTNVFAMVRPPEVVDGFMMDIIDHARNGSGVKILVGEQA